MAKRTGRLLTAALTLGLALSLGGTALAAPVGGLKQFKVPTANSEPRGITNGSDGNVWFTEGTDSTLAPPKIGRVTPDGTITEFDANCNSCILTDIVQGPSDILYAIANDASLLRFDHATEEFLPLIFVPDAGSASEITADGDDLWMIGDFASLVRYNTTTGEFTTFELEFDKSPADVVIDSAGDAWFTAPLDATINRLDPVTGTVVESFAVPNGLTPRQITIATDGQLWFTSRFVPQGVGRLNPTTGIVTTFATPSNPGPEGIAAGPGGAIWFVQTSKGNIARIDNNGVITEGKAVKNSDPLEIVVAPNGDPWYTMLSANKIATLQLR